MDVEKKLSCSLDELIKKQRHDNLKGKRKQQESRKIRAKPENDRKPGGVSKNTTKDRQLQKHRGSGARSLPAELRRRQPKAKSNTTAANPGTVDGIISTVSSRNRNRWLSRRLGASAGETGLKNSPRALLSIRRTGIPGKQLQGRTANSVLRNAIPILSRKAARRALAGGITAGELSRRAERRRRLDQVGPSRGNRSWRASALADRLSLRLNTSLNRQRVLRAKRQLQIAKESVSRQQTSAELLGLDREAQYWRAGPIDPQQLPRDGNNGRRIVSSRNDKRGKLVSALERTAIRKAAGGALAEWRRSPNGSGNKPVGTHTRVSVAVRGNAGANAAAAALASHRHSTYDAVYNSANTGFRRVRRNAAEFKERAISGSARAAGNGRYGTFNASGVVADDTPGMIVDRSNCYRAYEALEADDAVPTSNNSRNEGVGVVSRYSRGAAHEMSVPVDYSGASLLCDSTSEEAHTSQARSTRRSLGSATQQSQYQRQRGNSDSVGEKLSSVSSHTNSTALAASMGIPPSLLDKIKIVAELDHIPGPLRAQCGGINETLPRSVAAAGTHQRAASVGNPISSYDLDGATPGPVSTASPRHVTPNATSFTDPFYRPGGVTLSERFGGRRTVV